MWQVFNLVRKAGFTNKNFDIFGKYPKEILYEVQFFLFVITEYSPPFHIFFQFFPFIVQRRYTSWIHHVYSTVLLYTRSGKLNTECCK